MTEDERITAQGELWRRFTGPELLAALQAGEIGAEFRNGGVRFIVAVPERGPGPFNWDLADGFFR